MNLVLAISIVDEGKTLVVAVGRLPLRDVRSIACGNPTHVHQLAAVHVLKIVVTAVHNQIERLGVGAVATPLLNVGAIIKLRMIDIHAEIAVDRFDGVAAQGDRSAAQCRGYEREQLGVGAVAPVLLDVRAVRSPRGCHVHTFAALFVDEHHVVVAVVAPLMDIGLVGIGFSFNVHYLAAVGVFQIIQAGGGIFDLEQLGRVVAVRVAVVRLQIRAVVRSASIYVQALRAVISLRGGPLFE